jgi:hypothetical protein
VNCNGNTGRIKVRARMKLWRRGEITHFRQ